MNKVKYIYIDNSEHPVVRTVYECEADSILVADKKYEQVTGKDPKQRYIAVKIEKQKGKRNET